ncbi:MAG TPA: hypothetical protein VF519_03110 [Mycobacteriales bacterium]|jgi:hypothetical protein
MNRLSPTARLGLAFAASAALIQLATAAPAATTASVRRQHVPGPGELVLPGGSNVGETEPELTLPYAGIASLDAAKNQHEYALAAKALPGVNANLKWTNVGPLGQDDPKDYPQGGLRFARSAGMGSTIEIDPADATGSSVYVGNMGGLWHTTDTGKTWKNLSDSWTRGAVGAIAVDPQDPDTIYAGTGIGYLTTSGDAPGSGIWVTHDRGQTWTRPAKNIRGYATNDLLVTEDGVLAATTDGLYVSTDDGASFSRIAVKNNADHSAPAIGAYANWFSSLVVNPLDKNEVTVAVGMGQGKKPGPDGNPLSPGNGLYRSTTGIAGPYEYMESTSELQHDASTTDPIGRIMMTYVKDPGGDAAVLWVILSDAGLAYGQQPAEADLVSETTGQGANVTNTQLNGLYRSDDNGESFTLKATPQSLQTSVNSGLGIYPALGYGVGVQAYYNLWVQADPRNPDQVFFGLEEVYQSIAGTDSGPTLGTFEIIQRYWDVCGSTTYLENIFTGVSCPDQTPYAGGVSTHPDQHWGAVVDVDGTLRMYTANDGGFFVQDSHDVDPARNAFDNDAWVDMNTLATVQPYKVARKPDGEFLTALQDNGTGFFPPNDTQTLVTGGDGVNIVATSDPDTWYSTAQGAIPWVTTDHGKTIRAIPADLTGATFLSPLAIDPTDENHLVIAGQDIHETTKGPDTTSLIDPLLYTVIQTDWTQSYDAGTSEVSGGAFQSQTIGVRGENVYVGICGLCRNTLGDPTLVYSTVATNVQPGCTPAKASSECWHTATGKGLPHNSIWNLVIDPEDAKTVYVVLNNNSQIGYDPKVGGNQRVMVSHDAGESFQDITGNLRTSQARDIVVRGNNLIIATDHGVFTAPKTGMGWSRLGSGLPPVRVFDLHLDPTGRYLTASVYGRGVWTLDFQKTSSSSSGPGPKGEPFKPRPQTGGIPSTGADAAVAVMAIVFGGAALVTRRMRRRSAAAA